MPETPDIIREAIREARDAARLSDAELARRAAVHHGKLNRYLRGQGELRSDTINRLLVALDLRIVPARRRRHASLLNLATPRSTASSLAPGISHG